MDSETLTLPTAPAEPRRQPIPVLAAVVPIAAGVVLWLITGSIFSLCFAALGPLMIGASLLDGMRLRRRDRRIADEEQKHGWARADQELRRRHDREKRALQRAHPDAAGQIQDPPLRDLQPVDESTLIVLGAGIVPSRLRVTGDNGELARSFQKRASQLSGAPITAALGRGLCIRGPQPVARAAARALLVQLCLAHAPAQLAIVGAEAQELGVAGFPHAGRVRRGAWRLGVSLSPEQDVEASSHLHVRAADADVPEGITTVLDIGEPGKARLRRGNDVVHIAVECLSEEQARVVADTSIEREGEAAMLPDMVMLGELAASAGDSTFGLRAPIGRTEAGDAEIDLVEDGPHAIVTGMTGSGKSELLVSWIASMAREHGPDEVTFVLADFKGGTAFDPLRDLPHVAAVITDLDEQGARRGVRSLTAELRRRERILAGMGARNIGEAEGRMPRLVIVVDEFAALIQEHPDLAAVFTDIAARGRALGMHLVLGTQRASGVIRDALAANCPLRLSLRVTDASDSRLVIGTDDAAELPGGAASRGLAFLRRPQDAAPAAVRIALTGAGDIRAIAGLWADAGRAVSPWLAPLPASLALADPRVAPRDADTLVLGLSDEPDEQRQTPLTLRLGEDRGLAVIGGSGSGRTALIRVLAAQCSDALFVPADPEAAWDTVEALVERRTVMPRLLLCDDLDRIAAGFPHDYAALFLERFETLVRSAGAHRGCIVITASRLAGAVSRVVDALPNRMLLRTGTRMEHLAAGGDSDGYLRDRLPGRARMDEREVQIVWTEPGHAPEAGAPPTEAWEPSGSLIGVVAPSSRRVVEDLRRTYPHTHVGVVGDPAESAESAERGTPGILVGDAESWQRNWTLWQRVRGEGEMLLMAECTSELRSLAGYRELPPFVQTHRGRAWSFRDGAAPRRVILAGADES